MWNIQCSKYFIVNRAKKSAKIFLRPRKKLLYSAIINKNTNGRSAVEMLSFLLYLLLGSTDFFDSFNGLQKGGAHHVWIVVFLGWSGVLRLDFPRPSAIHTCRIADVPAPAFFRRKNQILWVEARRTDIRRKQAHLKERSWWSCRSPCWYLLSLLCSFSLLQPTFSVFLLAYPSTWLSCSRIGLIILWTVF